MLWIGVAQVALSEKAPVDFDKGRQGVTLGKIWCWLLSLLLYCVVLHFVSFASFTWATVVIVLLTFALRFVCHPCSAGAEHRRRVTGAAAREQWDAGMVSNNAHASGVATVACQLCVRSFLLCLRPVFVFAFLFLCVCIGQSNTRQHKR